MSSGRDTRGDPLKRCPRGCIFEATRRFCPWHGEPLGSLIGTQVADVYVIERLVSASGGFGVVYYAKTELGFEAAVKVLRPPACYDEKAVNDFVGEARKALQLEGCPNTVGVLVCGVKPFPFIVMTFVSGGALSERVRQLREEIQSGDGNAVRKRSKKIPIDFAYRVLVDIASALKVAHEKGIVHRDLKPGNALIRRDSEGRETVLVSDWGIAIARREGRKTGASEEDETLVPTRILPRPGLPSQATLPPVTINRAPPEFFKGNIDELYRPTADIYQFGILAYEVVTGEFPFSWPDATLTPEESWEFWRRQHCRVEGAGPVPLKQYRTDLATPWNPISTRRKRLARVVTRSLDVRPSRRYEDGGKLLSALTDVPPAERVARYAAAPVLLLVAFIIFLKFFGGSPGTLENFFDPERWATQTAGVFARDEPDAVAVDGDRYPVWRVWARSLSDLERRQGEPLVFTTYSLGSQQGLGKLESVSLERWDASVKEAEAVRSTAPIRKNSTLEGIATAEGNAVSIRLGELAGSLAKDRPADAAGVFTFSVRMGFAERTNPLVSFFQIVIDPKPPACELQQLSLAARGNSFDRKPYRLDPLKTPGANPPRLYAPDTYDDLECRVAVNEDLDDAPAVKVRLMEGMRVISEREVKPEESFRWFDSPARAPPIAVAAGTPLKIEVWAMDSAGMTRGEKEFAPETTKSYAFFLDSGPQVKVTAPEKRVIKGPGAALLPVSVVAEEPSTLRVYWGIDGDTVPPVQVDASSLEKDGIRIPLSGDAPGKLARGGSISIYCLEGDLIYPDMPGPPAEKDWMNLVSNAAQLVKFDAEPEAKVEAASFQMRMDSEDSFVSKRLLPRYDSTFEWRTNIRERYPMRLTLEPATRKDLNLEKVAWSVGGRVVKEGPVFQPELPAQGPSVLELGIDVASNWGTQGRFSARIEFDEKIPLFKTIEVVEDSGPPRPAFSGGEVLHLRSPSKLGFMTTTEDPRLDLYSARLVGTPRPPSTTTLGFRPKPEQGKIFFELESVGSDKVPQGIYELQFTCKDSFESTLEQKSYLLVHGAKPEISLSTPCNDRSNSLPAVQGECIVRVRVNDPSGLEAVTLDVEKETFAILRDGKMTAEADLEKVLGEQGVDPRTGRILSVEAYVSVPAGASRSIVVRALDHPVGTEAGTPAEPGYNSECKSGVACGEERLPPAVEWLGLDWVLIQSAGVDDSFYITRYEIPVWFWKGKGDAGRPPDEDIKSWAPQTNETPESIDEQLQGSPLLRSVYLPTLDEWKRIARGPDGRGDFVASGQIQPAVFRQRAEFAQLAKIVNSSDSQVAALKEQRKLLGMGNLVPVNFVPEGLQESGLFYGLYHFIGNAEEIVKLSNGNYGAAGGWVKATLQVMCTRKDGYVDIKPDEPDPFRLRGFRLVVYPSAPAARLAGEDRVESKVFGEVLRKPPVKQPKDAREAPEGSEGK